MNYQEYLDAHGIDKKFVEKEFRWEYREDAQAIIMPTFDEFGKVTHRCFRWIGDNAESKFTRDDKSKPSLYGIDKAKKFADVVYCEGQPDCVRLWQAGIPAVTADGGVGNITSKMAAKLSGKNVYLCVDTDAAGQKMVSKYFEVFSEFAQTVKIVDLPKVYKDVSEAFVAGMDKGVFVAMMKDSPSSLVEWRVANMPEQHRIESLGELFNADIPDEEWILEKVIPRSGFAIIAGASAVGKSFLALDMARAIACEKKWLDRYEVRQNVKVLFVDKENERASFRKRCRGLGMSKCSDKVFRIVSPELFNLESDERGEVFSEFAKDMAAFVEQNEIGLIVFDSLVDFMNGDENSAGDTMIFFDNIKKLLPGKAILFPAHYGKASKMDTRTPLERIAGSRNLGAQITSGLAVERSTEADNEVIVQSLKARNEVNDTTKFRVLLHSKADPEDMRSTIVTKIEFNGEVEEKVEKITGAIDLISSLSDENGVLGIKRQDAIKACEEAGIKERTANDAMKEMIRSGAFESIDVVGSKHREKAIVRRQIVPKGGMYE